MLPRVPARVHVVVNCPVAGRWRGESRKGIITMLMGLILVAAGTLLGAALVVATLPWWARLLRRGADVLSGQLDQVQRVIDRTDEEEN